MKSFSEIVSYITHPVFVPTTITAMYNTVQYIHHPYMGLLNFLTPILLVIITTLLLPLLIISFLKSQGEVDDIMMRQRESRTLIYCVMTSIFGLLCLLSSKLNYDVMIVMLCAEAGLLMAAITFINTMWKISIHSAGMGALTINTALIMLSMSPWLLLASVIICGIISCITIYARLDTNSHSPLQCLAGYALGFTMPQIILLCMYL